MTTLLLFLPQYNIWEKAKEKFLEKCRLLRIQGYSNTLTFCKIKVSHMNAYFSQRLCHLSHPNNHFLVAYTQKTTVSPTGLCLSINSCLWPSPWVEEERGHLGFVGWKHVPLHHWNQSVSHQPKLCSYSLWQAYGRQQLGESCVTIIWRGAQSYSDAKGKHSSGHSLSTPHLCEVSGHSLGSWGHQGS